MSRRAGAARRQGHVSTYDAAAGHGTLVDSAGEWYFHCTAIADGSRTISDGTEVSFVLVPGQRGQLEARDVHPN